MCDRNDKRDESRCLSGLQAALAYVAERRRWDPSWSTRFDTTYNGPPLAFLEKMTEADYSAWQAEKEKLRQWLRGGASLAEPPPSTVNRVCLPFGQRVRDLRRATKWTQSQLAWQLGVSRRSIIRYEQGQSAPIQGAPLLAMRRLESAFAGERTGIQSPKRIARPY
jgi:DNA-binding transcriptional regulator YiaG